MTLPGAPLPGMFDDLYAMAGLGGQENFIIPDSDMLVTWTGVLGDVSTDPRTLLNAAFTDPHRRDPGPYRQDYNLSVRPEQSLDAAVSLGTLGLGPDAPAGRNLIARGSGMASTQGPSQNLAALLSLAAHSATSSRQEAPAVAGFGTPREFRRERCSVAEDAGFEPARAVTPNTLSKRAP